jgi:hypothetical protein
MPNYKGSTSFDIKTPVKCPLLLSNFNQNWDVSLNFCGIPKYHISLSGSSYKWTRRQHDLGTRNKVIHCKNAREWWTQFHHSLNLQS